MQATIKRLEAKRPKKTSAYNMHVQAVTAAQHHALLVGGTHDFIQQQDVVRIAAESWKDLPPEELAFLQGRARAHQGKRRREIGTRFDHL